MDAITDAIHVVKAGRAAQAKSAQTKALAKTAQAKATRAKLARDKALLDKAAALGKVAPSKAAGAAKAGKANGTQPAKAALPNPAPVSDVCLILTTNEVRTLQQNFDRTVFLNAAPKMIKYGKAAGLTNWISGTIYGTQPAQAPNQPVVEYPPTALTDYEREILVVANAAMKGDSYTLSGHLYWAMMEDAAATQHYDPVERLADVLTTIGAYNGVDNLRWSLAVFAELLQGLKTIAGSASTATTPSVLANVLSTFPSW